MDDRNASSFGLATSALAFAAIDGIWQTLRARLDYSTFVPRLVPNVERSTLRRRDGSTYTVLKNPNGDRGAGLYVTLEPEDLELVELMDGARTVQDILVTHLEHRGVLAISRLARITAALAANGFFGEERPPVYEKLLSVRARRDPLTRISLWLRRLVMWDVARWNNAEKTVDIVYRLGGWLAFTRVGAAAVIVFALAGIVVLLRGAGPHELITFDGSYALGLIVLIALQVLSISVHEAGHALAIRHYGRRVRRLGLAIYYLFPCMYVDSTDMTMAPRRQRIIVALAGPVAGMTIGAACAFVAAVDSGAAGSIAFKAANLFLFQLVLNLLPILELDGYYILVDLLDAPLLRQRSMAFARNKVVRKLRRRERWTSTELGLGFYGVLAIVTSVLMVVLALSIWQSRLGTLARELLALGPVGLLVLLSVTLVLIGPLLVALAGRGLAGVRGLIRRRAAVLQRAKAAALDERAKVLARIRFLAGLPGPALLAIASHLEEHEIPADTTVITVGEPGDRFYLVRSGRLQVIAEDGAVKGTIIPGEGFGELALLDRRPRGATVRTLEPSVLWSLDRGHFERWVTDRYEIAARIRASAAERAELAALPFFRGLEPQELDRISQRLVARRFPAGAVVFREGDPADGYYIVREGEAEVSAGGSVLRRLGRGEGFGELALLFGTPRTATITATADLTLAGLARADFARLVRGSGEKLGEFRARTAHYVGTAGIGSAVGGA